MCPACVASVGLIRRWCDIKRRSDRVVFSSFTEHQQINAGHQMKIKGRRKEEREMGESPENRVAAGVGGCARAAPGEGEGLDALAGRAGAERRRMPWMAVEKEYEFDGPKGKVSLLDLFERPPAIDRLSRLLRARRVRLARPCLPRLLLGRRPGFPPGPSERPRHHAGVRLARAAGGHRAPEGANGLEDAVVHHHGQLRQRLRRGRVARP